MENNNLACQKISIECAKCKAKFDIWISMSEFTPEVEETIRKNFLKHCPMCRALEEIKRKEETNLSSKTV